MRVRTLAVITMALLIAGSAWADPWAGVFRADIHGEPAELRLQGSESGTYTGALTFMGETAPLTASERSGQLYGRMEAGPGEFVDFTAIAEGNVIHIQFANGVSLTLASAPTTPPTPGVVAEAGEVWINGAKLTASAREQITQMELQLHPGRYWYDGVCGAWGFMGGPTMGFIPAGLPVEKPLPADASNGNTQVFVNGRRLPMRDWVLLSQLAEQQITPGRYWIDANGFAGYEGGPALINLVAAAQRRGGAGQTGGGGTWSSLLSSGGSDGQGNGFVQLPDGGFVSHGN